MTSYHFTPSVLLPQTGGEEEENIAVVWKCVLSFGGGRSRAAAAAGRVQTSTSAQWGVCASAKLKHLLFVNCHMCRHTMNSTLQLRLILHGIDRKLPQIIIVHAYKYSVQFCIPTVSIPEWKETSPVCSLHSKLLPWNWADQQQIMKEVEYCLACPYTKYAHLMHKFHWFVMWQAVEGGMLHVCQSSRWCTL